MESWPAGDLWAQIRGDLHIFREKEADDQALRSGMKRRPIDRWDLDAAKGPGLHGSQFFDFSKHP